VYFFSSSRSRRAGEVWQPEIQDERVCEHNQQAEGQEEELLHDEAQDQDQGQEVIQGEAVGAQKATAQAAKV
jgi:hypothetical protein